MREEIRIEVESLTPNNNLTKNHLENQIIGSKDKGVMIRNIVHKELCSIYQVEPKSTYKACMDDYWIQAIKEELYQSVKNET